MFAFVSRCMAIFAEQSVRVMNCGECDGSGFQTNVSVLAHLNVKRSSQIRVKLPVINVSVKCTFYGGLTCVPKILIQIQ